MASGEVVAIPAVADDLLVIESADSIRYEEAADKKDEIVEAAWYGAVLLPDGRILGGPFEDDRLLEIESRPPVQQRRSWSSATFAAASVWVLGLNGKGLHTIANRDPNMVFELDPASDQLLPDDVVLSAYFNAY